MKCEFTKKVSMLIDGELPEAESVEIRAHIEDCAECRNAEKGFLFFRQQLKESAKEVYEKYKLTDFQTAEEKPFWKKEVRLPIPVFASLMIFTAVLFVWAAVLSFTNSETISADKNTPKIPVQKPDSSAEDEDSLAKFDKGKRAEIYVVSRVAKENLR